MLSACGSRIITPLCALIGFASLSVGVTGCHKQAANNGDSASKTVSAGTPVTLPQLTGSTLRSIFGDSDSGASESHTSGTSHTATLRDLPPLSPLPEASSTTQSSGVIVCDPVPTTGVDEQTAAFSAGCGEWLEFTIAGMPELGQSPLLTSVARAKREGKHDNFNLSPEEGISTAAATGATNVAVGTVSGSGEQTTLTYSLYDASSGKTIGNPITVTGAPEKIQTALPDVARQIAQRLGVTSPHLPASVDASQTELTAIGRCFWKDGSSQDNFKIVQSAASHCALADICALAAGRYGASTGFNKNVANLFTRLAPNNALGWGEVAYLNGESILPYTQHLDSLRTAFKYNYAFAHTDIWRNRVSGTLKGERRAAEDAVRDAPGNPEAWLSLGWTISSAAERVRRSRVANQITGEDWDFLHKSYSLWESAIKKATEIDPHHEVAWTRLASAALFASDDSTAYAAFNKAEQYDPNKQEVYTWGMQMFQSKWGGSKADLDRVADDASKADYPTTEEAGFISVDLRDLQYVTQADALLQRYLDAADAALAKDPNDVNAHWNKASILYWLNLKPASCREYALVAQMLPNNAKAQYDYAIALNDRENWDKCIEAYHKVLALDPNNTEAPIRLGTVLKHQKQFTEAEKWLKIGLERLPNAGRAHSALGEVYLWGPKKRPSEAAVEFRKAMELGDLSTSTYAYRTLALTDAGQIGDAIRWGEEGVVRVSEGKDSLAPYMHDALSYAYLHAKRYQDAVNEASITQETTPNDLTANEVLGDAYNALDQRAEARKSWRIVTQNNMSDDPEGIAHAKAMLAKYPAK